jgi:CheY-like chemotaxis protein
MASQKQPIRIFLAEDHDPDVTLICEALNASGLNFELDRALDGEAAIERLLRYGTSDSPDVILLDLNLPKIGGFALLSHLRANPVLLPVPVVILTSSREPADREEAMRKGAAAFISKPHDLADFIAAVGGTVRQMLRTKYGGDYEIASAGGHYPRCRSRSDDKNAPYSRRVRSRRGSQQSRVAAGGQFTVNPRPPVRSPAQSES